MNPSPAKEVNLVCKEFIVLNVMLRGNTKIQYNNYNAKTVPKYFFGAKVEIIFSIIF